MLKALLLIHLSRKRFYTQVIRDLHSRPQEAAMLGFPVRKGGVLLPSVKTFWHYDMIRMAPRWGHLFELMVKQAVQEARVNGLELGRRTLQDATPAEALPGDEEAEYSGHYRIRGYKLGTVTDLDQALPLAKATTGINEDEAKVLVPQMEALEGAGIRPEEHWIDGGYDHYSNLAWLGTRGVEAHHPIHENWVYNPKGDVDRRGMKMEASWRRPSNENRARQKVPERPIYHREVNIYDYVIPRAMKSFRGYLSAAEYYSYAYVYA